MTPLPGWYRPVTIVALVWNLLGCAAYLADVSLSPEEIAALTPGQQAMYASRPAWAVAATAVAVWFGAAGSLGLVLGKEWALPLLVASLAGVAAMELWLFVLSDAGSSAGAMAFFFQAVVLLVAVGLVALARTARTRGWIGSTS